MKRLGPYDDRPLQHMQLEARVKEPENLLKQIRQWDMLNPAFGAGEPTADAPYWRAAIDRVLAK